MPRLLFSVLLLAGLAGCFARPFDGLEAELERCRAPWQADAWRDAFQACTEVIARTQSYGLKAEALDHRGVIYARTGRDSEALADFSEAIRLSPDYAMAYANRANVLSTQRRHDLAVRDFEAALDRDPDNALILNNYAWDYLLRGDYVTAQALTDRVLALAPTQSAAHDTRAHALMGLRQTEPAQAAFARAAKLGGAERVARYQDALIAKGYAPGRSDGVMDAATRAALAACVRDNCRLLLD